MRITRVVAAALSLTVVLSTLSSAQSGRGFRDAWFWGVKAGGMGYATLSGDPTVPAQSYGQAPLVGVEWLITRTNGALYMSYGQAFFKQQTFMPASVSPTDTTIRLIDVKNARRLDLALMAYPGDNTKLFRPYVGAGFAFQSVGSATPQGTFTTEDDLLFTTSVLQEAKAVISPVFIAGGQRRFESMSMFGQVSISPSNRSWILYNGRPMTFSYEIGLRYNMGSSIAR